MNKYELLKKRLLNREVIFGENMMTFNSTILTEKLNDGPVDFILFDCEHGIFNNENLVPQFQVCRLMGLPSVVRVVKSKYDVIARALDLGADGIMIPRVESLNEIQDAVDAMKFPPVGKTGRGGWAQLREGETPEEYNGNRFLFVQIESRKGIDLIPEMFGKYGEHISGIIVGPFDLSIDLGIPEQFDDPRHLEAMQEIFDTCKKYQKSVGTYCYSAERAKLYNSMGANIIWLASDEIIVNTGFHAIYDEAYKLRKE